MSQSSSKKSTPANNTPTHHTGWMIAPKLTDHDFRSGVKGIEEDLLRDASLPGGDKLPSSQWMELLRAGGNENFRPIESVPNELQSALQLNAHLIDRIFTNVDAIDASGALRALNECFGFLRRARTVDPLAPFSSQNFFVAENDTPMSLVMANIMFRHQLVLYVIDKLTIKLNVDPPERMRAPSDSYKERYHRIHERLLYEVLDYLKDDVNIADRTLLELSKRAAQNEEIPNAGKASPSVPITAQNKSRAKAVLKFELDREIEASRALIQEHFILRRGRLIEELNRAWGRELIPVPRYDANNESAIAQRRLYSEFITLVGANADVTIVSKWPEVFKDQPRELLLLIDQLNRERPLKSRRFNLKFMRYISNVASQIKIPDSLQKVFPVRLDFSEEPTLDIRGLDPALLSADLNEHTLASIVKQPGVDPRKILVLLHMVEVAVGSNRYLNAQQSSNHDPEYVAQRAVHLHNKRRFLHFIRSFKDSILDDVGLHREGISTVQQRGAAA